MSQNTVISADSHVFEPVDLWDKRLDRKYRDNGPRFVNDWQGKKGTWFVAEGIAPRAIASIAAAGIPKEDLVKFKDVLHKDLRAGGYDPAERLKDQDVDGVSAEVLYATYAMNLYAMPNAELQEASFNAYNEWMCEMTSHAPDRLVGLSLISMYDVPKAVKALERWTKRGLGGSMIAVVPPEGSEYSDKTYEPFWAKAEDMQVPISIHTLTSSRKAVYRFDRETRGAARYPENPMEVMLTLGEMLTSGLFDRFPPIHCVDVSQNWGIEFLR